MTWGERLQPLIWRGKSQGTCKFAQTPPIVGKLVRASSGLNQAPMKIVLVVVLEASEDVDESLS